MHPGQDPFGAPSSFTSRKSAAGNLPPFELPPPPLAALHSKYLPFAGQKHSSQSQATSGSVASAGNLLTPPNTLPGEGVSPATPNSAVSGQGIPPYTTSAGGYWSHAAQSAPQYGPYHSGTTPQWIPPRGMFSPSSLDTILRHNGGNGAEMMPQQPYEMNHLPPFASSMSMSAPASLPAMSAAQQQQQTLNNAILNGQSSLPNSANHNLSPVSSHEQYSARPPPTPTYFTTQPSPTTHQMAFAPYSTHHHGQGSLISPTNSSHHRMSPPGSNGENHGAMSASSQSPPQYQRSYAQYPLPAMTGPVMSNIQNPGGQLALVGGLHNGMMAGFNSGHAASIQQIYGGMHHNPQQQQPPNDRPFKCDQCVQSFNRNHDLKRHKRIHLAVKPYPCGHCDKSFSRKDALKRHILVKGCGKSGPLSDSSDSKEKSLSVSPMTKSESLGHSISPPRANAMTRAEA